MKSEEIVQRRLQNQRISGTPFSTPEEVMDHMLAMQAQDFSMSKWGIGARMKNALEATVDEALNSGRILRTHLLRPTWHLIGANDIYWVLELSRHQLIVQTGSRRRELEITAETMKQCRKIFENAMRDGKSVLREDLKLLLEKKKIATDNYRLGHILFHAELEGLICSGASEKNKASYALLEERVPKKKFLSKEESLSLLAEKYFKSRGPATFDDFHWWSGLKISDARKALEIAKPKLQSVNIGQQVLWFTDAKAVSLPDAGLYLLPAYDEFIISYKDRSAALPSKIQNKVISNNGIFWPVMLHKYAVCGLWKRAAQADKVDVTGTILIPKYAATKKQFEEKAGLFGNFLGKKSRATLIKNK